MEDKEKKELAEKIMIEALKDSNFVSAIKRSIDDIKNGKIMGDDFLREKDKKN